MPWWRFVGVLLLALGFVAEGVGASAGLSRSQALKALGDPSATRRASAIDRLAEIGTMADADVLVLRLRDRDENVRDLAAMALWLIWARSGDRKIDKLYQRGVAQMNDGDLPAALATFSEVVRRKPAFAEGWNKRATVLYLLDQDAASLRDCDEVLKRNRHHFGALSGMAQIHLRRGDPERALAAYQRALEVNPNLDGGPEMLQFLQDAVQSRAGQRV
jgi:tetratricopeptide (TPR) repeat protein